MPEKELKEEFYKHQKEPTKELGEELSLPDLPIEDDPVKTISPFIIDFGTTSVRAAANQTTGKIRITPTVTKGTSSRKFLKIHPDFLVSGVLEAQGLSVSVVGTVGTDTTLRSYTVPLNTISLNDTQTESVGNVFRVWAAGRYTTDDAASTVDLKCKIGSTTVHTITSTGATVTNAPWFIQWTFIVLGIGSAGSITSFAHASINNVGKDVSSTSTTTVDTTANQAITITAAWTGGSAGDDISIRSFLIELLN